MMGYRNLNKSFAIIAALLMALCAFAVLTAEDADASAQVVPNGIKASDFKQDHAGTLTISLCDCVSTESVRIEVYDGTTEKVNATYNNLSDDNDVSVSFKLSKGVHEDIYVKVYVDGSLTYANQITIESKDNIWSHVSSYVVMVILVLVVVIIAVVYMRARPNNKPTTTFTQLEEEKKAATATKAPAPTKTEKVKYSSSRRK